MRRYNRRLYRIARAILHSDTEAGDVMQDAYVCAYEHLERFAAWLTRIAVHEALARQSLTEDNVQVRLHRGHGMIRSWLLDRIGADAKEAFPFMADRCNRVVEGVFNRLAAANAADLPIH
jgi:hypothetical protein